ncbi:MAG: DNA repair protein RadA [Patescibacteria group bacterium]|nr:DNA repair protein RadA [Patescibacteria group bacterium]
MSKSTTQFTCQSCGAVTTKWSGKCMQCDAWDSLVENPVINTSSRKGGVYAPSKKPDKFHEIEYSENSRIGTGNSEVDSVLGGGIVPGSLVLLAGDPGIGKSTLVLQLAGDISKNKKVLYVSGEESAAQVKLRGGRIKDLNTDFEFMATTDVDEVLSHTHGGNYDLIIVDSIQTMSSQSLSGAAGTTSQVTNNTNSLVRAAKDTNTAFIIIGHVTKEGNVAGPRLMEHLVDTVLYLEGERYGLLKMLRSVKNRFGATNEVGMLEMTEMGLKAVSNPSEALLMERQELPGSVIFVGMEGTRPILVEVQALVSPSVFGYPKRVADGFDLNRLGLLCAVMQKRGGVNLSTQDVYVNIVGGIKLAEPAIDLAIILAIASASSGKIINPGAVVFGEVGLSGEIRSVNMSNLRLQEAKKLGFNKAIVPSSIKGINYYGAKTIADAIKNLK